MHNEQKQLENLLIPAIRNTVQLVLNQFPTHHFYYFALTTSGELLTPGHSFWSEELLEETARRQGSNVAELKANLRYSYADSPLFYIGERFFAAVNDWFHHRAGIDTLSEEAWETEASLRLGAMINALRILIGEGIFGTDEAREKWFINVEVNPPDGSNYDRAILLNSPEKVAEWLQLGGE